MTVRVNKKGFCDKIFDIDKDVKFIGPDSRTFAKQIAKDDDFEYLYISTGDKHKFAMVKFNGHPFATKVTKSYILNHKKSLEYIPSGKEK